MAANHGRRQWALARRLARRAIHYFRGNPMHKITTLDDNWMGRPRSIGTALLESDGHRPILDPRPGSTMARWPSDSDRKSTRLNSRHPVNSYTVFCLKKKKTTTSSR